MSLFVARNGQSEGPLPPAEVEARLRSGGLAPTDLGWREGMADWAALATLFPGVGPAPAPAPLARPAPAPAAASTSVSLPRPPAGKVPSGIPALQPRPEGLSFGAHAFAGFPAAVPAPIPAPVPAPIAAVPAAAPAPTLEELREELRREREKSAALEKKLAVLEERARRATALLKGDEGAAA